MLLDKTIFFKTYQKQIFRLIGPRFIYLFFSKMEEVNINKVNEVPNKLDPIVAVAYFRNTLSSNLLQDQLKRYFFDPGNFAKHLTDLGFDVGKLRQTTPETISKAEEILKDLAVKIPEAEKNENVAGQIEEYNTIQALGKEFYSLIGHLPTVQ